jgi:hypothetical protein
MAMSSTSVIQTVAAPGDAGIVRRFTDSLIDNSTLTSSTKEAQRQLELRVEARARLRADKLVEKWDHASK